MFPGRKRVKIIIKECRYYNRKAGSEMTIDRLGPIDPLSKLNKTGKAGKTVKPDSKDTISVSDEAKNLGEIYRASELVKASPDIRMDRVEEVRQKLQDPDYIDSKIEEVADRLMDAFGLS